MLIDGKSAAEMATLDAGLSSLSTLEGFYQNLSHPDIYVHRMDIPDHCSAGGSVRV